MIIAMGLANILNIFLDNQTYGSDFGAK